MLQFKVETMITPSRAHKIKCQRKMHRFVVLDGDTVVYVDRFQYPSYFDTFMRGWMKVNQMTQAAERQS